MHDQADEYHDAQTSHHNLLFQLPDKRMITHCAMAGIVPCQRDLTCLSDFSKGQLWPQSAKPDAEVPQFDGSKI